MDPPRRLNLRRELEFCEGERFLDDCFWENQRTNTFILPSACEPVFVRPKLKARQVVIGGAGDCWRKLLEPFVHADDEFPAPIDDLDSALPFSVFHEYCIHFFNFLCDMESAEEWLLDIRPTGEGMLHLEAVYFRDELPNGSLGPWAKNPYDELRQDDSATIVIDKRGNRKVVSASGGCRSFEAVQPPRGCISLDDFVDLDPTKICPDTLVGAGNPLQPSVRAQIPDAFDISLEPVAWEHSKELVKKLAKWYWDFRSKHPDVPRLGPEEPPPGIIPNPPLPFPGQTPPLEDMPHFMTPLEQLTAYLRHLISDAGEGMRLVFQNLLDSLRRFGFDIDNPLKLLLLDFPVAIREFAKRSATYARYLLERWGALDLVDHLGDLPAFLTGFLYDAINLSTNFLEWGFLGIKLLNFLFQDFTEYHGPEVVYRRSLIAGELDFALFPACLLENHAQVAHTNIVTGVAPRVLRMMRESAEYDSNVGPATAINNLASDIYRRAAVAVDNLPTIILPESVAAEDVEAFQNCVPTFNVARGVTDHPHPRPAGIRRYFRQVANDFLARRDRPVRAVGASNTEMPTIARLVHNCWPNDSGRTDYRQKNFHTPANAFHRQLTHDHRFEHCPHIVNEEDVFGADIWSFFSAHDITPEVFLREMAASASDTAVVALHLPFPLMDRRVTCYTDPLAGLHYEVHGEKVLVYHLDGHSAGYTHDLHTLIKWMGNLPTFLNAHVQAETLAQVGTAVLLAVTIGRGKQEVVPALWQCQTDPFYLLPELLDADLNGGELRFFAVAARKFEQLVAYVASLQPTQLSNEFIIPKIRGMMAEIRIGVHSVEPRWSVTLPQLYSLVKHAVIANELFSRSAAGGEKRLRKYYTREAWRHGGLMQRLIQGRIDMVLHFRGEAQPLDSSSFWKWLTTNRYAHRGVFNPYQRAGTYRIAALDVRHSDNLTSLGFLQDFSRKLGGSVWRYVLRPTVTTVAGVAAAVNRGRRREPQPWEIPLPVSVASSVAHSRSSSTSSAGSREADLFSEIDESSSDSEAALSEVEIEIDAADGSANGGEVIAPHVDTPPPASALGLEDVGTFARHYRLAPPSVVSDVSVDSASGPDADPPEPPPLAPDHIDHNHNWVQRRAKTGHVYSLADVGFSQSQARLIDFAAPCLPIANQHPADDAFRPFMAGKVLFEWPTEPVTVPCPSNGGTEIVEAAFLARNVGEFPRTYLPSLRSRQGGGYRPKHLVRALDSDADTPEAAAAIRATVERFVETISPIIATNHRIKVLTIVGPPMSAKSSLVRTYVKTKHRRAVVYVPSRKLRDDWCSDAEFKQYAKVLYRNQPLRNCNAQVAVIDEIFNWSPLEVQLLLRLFASKGITMCILVGDPAQCSTGGIHPEHELLCHKLQLHTSLGMPLDAHGWFVRINRLDPHWYTTTGTAARSIFFVEDETALVGFEPDLEFKMHSHSAGRTELTVGRVQGSRARDALFRYDMNARNAAWLNESNAFKSVAITRHTRNLVVLCNSVTRLNLDPAIRRFQIVGARVDSKHVFAPDRLDDLVIDIKAKRVTDRIAKLRGVLAAPLALEGHAVVLPPVDKAPERDLAIARPAADLRAMVLEQTNFELPEPAERDFVTARPRVSFKFRDPGPPTQRDDVRNDVENSHLLAAIHVNSSAFDAAKNLIDRQIATTKRATLTAADRREGLLLYRRFRECYYDDTMHLIDTEVAASWLADTEVAALQMIASSEPLGETAGSFTCDAEFKTQTKAKAQPGFAATLPYGQSIIANKKIFNAYFASEQPKLYTNLVRMMRPGVILDYGMSDQQLSDQLLKLGVAEDMNGSNNIQADVSKQDSSHTPATLIAFLLTARDAGLSNDSLALYLAYCQRYSFTSRGDDGIRAAVSFNLGSGDPFTLIRNDHQEMTVIACRYARAKDMIIVEKGDDVHGVIKSLAPHRFSTLPSIRSVKLTVDFGAVGYHAGRFHNGARYLVDPIRAFLKHFTRLSDENVTVDELYRSYVSRATDYTEAEVSFLSAACQAHYPHYQAEVIDMMIHTMLSMREKEVFVRYCTLRVKPFSIAVDTRSNCVEQCLRLMYPRWPKSKLRDYRGREMSELRVMLQSDGVPFRVVEGQFDVMVDDVLHLSRTHARVRVSHSRMSGSKDL